MNLAIAIIGPTASGKSAFALDLAEKIGGEIICMDSTTVYRGFNIGSAKPSLPEQDRIPHHLIDILEPTEPFSAFHFVQRAEEAIQLVQEKGKTPIVVGGTYFYLRALQKGMYPNTLIPSEVLESIEQEYFEDEQLNTAKMHEELAAKDPKAAKKIHPNDRYRLLRALAILRTSDTLPSAQKISPLTKSQSSRVWLKYSMLLTRPTLNQRMIDRTENMLRLGLVEETRLLLDKFPKARALASIGYNECVSFLNKKITEKQLRNEIIEKTRQLGKRQVTWIRADPEIRFIDFEDQDRLVLEHSNLKFVLEETT